MKKEICDNCAYLGMGFHQLKERKTYTFECQSFEGKKKGRRVKLTDSCDFFLEK